MAHTPRVHFYAHIETRYGADLRSAFKDYANDNRKLGNMTSRKSFLIRCRKRGVFPTHISSNFRFTFPLLEEISPYTNKIQKSITRFMKSILNIEIKHTFYKIQTIKTRMSTIAQTIMDSGVPEEVYASFFENQSKYNEKYTTSRSNKTKRKFSRIIERAEESSHEQIPTINEKAIHNGTQVNIPPETQVLLSLGPKFALPQTKTDPIFFYHMLADVEEILKSNPDTTVQDRTRCAITNSILNYLHHNDNRNRELDPLVKFCSNAERITRRFLSENPTIVVLKSDKGNKTVLMETQDYKTKMLELLQDRSTYEPISRDPTSRYQQQNNSLVNRLRNLGLIDRKTASRLTTYKAVCPRIYGQPKAHKPGLPLRPVVPNMTAPSYQLSKFVGSILQKSLVSEYNIKDSYTFCEFINNVTLPENYVLISLDVKALFTSIPKSLVLNNIIMRWDEIKPNTNINLDLFLEIVEYCIDSSYFRYDGQHYHQIFGTAMGNPLSSATADWIMESLLNSVLNKLNIPLPFIRKFVDDLVTAIPLNQLQSVLQAFNSYDTHIQFTHELEVDNCLPFLDMLLIRHENQKVTTRW
ncbi:uncharacterized protein LOC134287713 [Aedes albopictus]|uniref:Reverse transcriptase domain-containing protein n=1 Tax=Aedes albopictus TaxID=7160 RepID=A0ABM1YNC3_AEDAL